MHDQVSCPKCGNEFAVGAALHGQVRVQLQGEMHVELQRRLDEAKARSDQELADAREREAAAAAAKEAELLRMRRELEAEAANAVLEREQTLAAERASVRAEAERVVEERMALRSAERLEQERRESAARLGDVMQDLEEARKRVESAALKERELLRRERELTEARSTIDLETERRMVAERSKIQADAEAQAAARISLVQEQARLRDKEQEEKTAQLQRSVDALQQRLTQGPQQAQGEAQELVLKDILVEAFGEDCIEDVEKGVRGADLAHRVYSASGAECGTILWESSVRRAGRKAAVQRRGAAQRGGRNGEAAIELDEREVVAAGGGLSVVVDHLAARQDGRAGTRGERHRRGVGVADVVGERLRALVACVALAQRAYRLA